ncbi:MAG: hypothetical protein AB7F64_07455 [Gammaproteobacteria bacterium]
MIKRLFHIAITGFLLNAGHVLAISPILLEYTNAALAQAIDQDNDDLALAIVKYKGSFDYNYTLNLIDCYLRHSFLDAIAAGDIQKVQTMLKDGVDFNEIKQSVTRISPHGITQMEEEGAMQVAIKYAPNSSDMVRLLLDAGIDPGENFVYEKRQAGNEEGDLLSSIETPLSLIYQYNKLQLIDLLQNFKIEVDQEYTEIAGEYRTQISDKYFRHPLIEAIKKGKLDLAQEMIKKGVDLNQVSQGVIRSDKQGNSGIFEEEGILQIAIKYAPHAYEAVKLLLDNGLNPNQNPFKYVLREEFLKNNPQGSYIDPIYLALEHQKLDVLELLTQPG